MFVIRGLDVNMGLFVTYVVTETSALVESQLLSCE